MTNVRTLILIAIVALTAWGQPEGKKSPAMAVDPVCGMQVDPKTSDKSVYKGKTYYFCNRSDKEAFEKSPDKYLKPDKSKK